MKALAKVYPVLVSGRFFAVLLSFVGLFFSLYLWKKPSHSNSDTRLVRFTAGNFSQAFALKESIELLPFEFEGTQWNAAAIKTESLGDILADLAQKNRAEKKPFVGFLRDGQDKDYIVCINKAGDLAVSSVASLSISRKGIEVKMPEEVGHEAFYFRVFP